MKKIEITETELREMVARAWVDGHRKLMYNPKGIDYYIDAGYAYYDFISKLK
jgi:hypothetical protein